MSLLYNLGVRAYVVSARVAALFSSKAKARVSGAEQSLIQLSPTPVDQPCYWMHCASVGEFEQGRPLWDRLMAHEPNARFVLSFFSPSGYDVFAPKKNSVGEVVYLPWDIGSNAQQFVRMLSPKLAVFVKYEWWLGYFEALSSQEVPTVVISAAFRQNQPFFKRNLLQKNYRRALDAVAHLFVQDEASAQLLKGIGQSNYTVTGDTRIDRTLTNRAAALDAPNLTDWAANAPYLMVAGSTWLEDVELLANTLHNHDGLQLLIAPHEVNEKSTERTAQVLAKAVPSKKILQLSALSSGSTTQDLSNYRVIIVDSIGLLSKLYRLGKIAYIGGGFGAGIHNTLEAAVYGIPLAFGPKHEKFQEAIALVDQKIATVISNTKDLSNFVDKFGEAETRIEVLAKAEQYIALNQGATQHIWNFLIERKLI